MASGGQCGCADLRTELSYNQSKVCQTVPVYRAMQCSPELSAALVIPPRPFFSSIRAHSLLVMAEALESNRCRFPMTVCGFKVYLLLFCVYGYFACIYVCVHTSVWCQKRVLNALELELQTVLGHCGGAGNPNESSGKASGLSYWVISPV